MSRSPEVEKSQVGGNVLHHQIRCEEAEKDSGGLDSSVGPTGANRPCSSTGKSFKNLYLELAGSSHYENRCITIFLLISFGQTGQA